jgi:hypothetical protein
MAKPRVFLSSTYFDLKSVRADLEHFVREQGFDPVLHERGSVPYGSGEALERYCYKEIENCDIVVSIIGGRFGTKSADSVYSVSQTELRTALEASKQVYVFVEQGVYHEYRTYERNKDSPVKWAAVDNPRVYDFLGEVYGLKNNNPIMPFETSFDITENLKEQWAGLFQRLLAQQSLSVQASMFHDLKQSLETVRSLVDIASSHADRRDEVVASLVLLTHPLFSALKNKMSVTYRFVVESIAELNKWMEARGFTEDLLNGPDDDLEYFKQHKTTGNTEIVKVSREVFDAEGKLKPYMASDWSDDFVRFEIRRPSRSPSPFDPSLDDDVPF